MASLAMGFADFPIDVFRGMKKAKVAPEDENAKGKGNAASANATPAISLTAAEASAQAATPLEVDESTGSTIPPRSSASSVASFDPSESTLEGTDAGSTIATSNTGDERQSRASLDAPKSRDTSTSPARSRSRSKSPNKFTLESAISSGKGLSRIIEAGMKSPMDFTLGLARGFHNAPKLYGDDTVRPQSKVTGIQSGLKAAGKEFGYGFYDGITGLVTQPMDAVKKEGGAGLLKGFGKGIGGIVLKPGAGKFEFSHIFFVMVNANFQT
jgi:hypothetical protein